MALYDFSVMPFGIINAPTQSMNMMNDLLGECLHKFVLVFLEDVLIYFANTQDHAKHLRKYWGSCKSISYMRKATNARL